MAVQTMVENVVGIMTLDLGYIDGKMKMRNKSYAVHDTAEDEAIFESMQILASLQKHDIVGVKKRTNESIFQL